MTDPTHPPGAPSVYPDEPMYSLSAVPPSELREHLGALRLLRDRLAFATPGVSQGLLLMDRLLEGHIPHGPLVQAVTVNPLTPAQAFDALIDARSLLRYAENNAFGVRPEEAPALALLARFALGLYEAVMERHPDAFQPLTTVPGITTQAIGLLPERVQRDLLDLNYQGEAQPGVEGFARRLQITRELPQDPSGHAHAWLEPIEDLAAFESACRDYLFDLRSSTTPLPPQAIDNANTLLALAGLYLTGQYPAGDPNDPT